MTSLPLLRLLAILALIGGFLPVAKGEMERWVLRDGTEVFGEPQAYDFETKKVTLLKADGKEYGLDATKLTFAGKLQLFHSSAFGTALDNYSPPFMPILILMLAIAAFLIIPVLFGVWGGAHVLGAIDSPVRHTIGVGKVVVILLAAIVIYLTASTIMDPELPLIPDKNGDILLILSLVVMSILVSALVLSGHYGQTFFRGLGISVLSGVFSSVVFAALFLVGLFILTRADNAEAIMDRLVFQPLGWF